MKLPSSRILIALVLTVLFFIFIVAFLFITNLSFSVWEQLQQKPQWLIWTYAIVIALIAIIFGHIIWRLLMPALISGKKRSLTEAKTPAANNIEATTQRLDEINQKISAQGYSTPSSKQGSHLVETTSVEIEADGTESSAELLSLQAELQEYTRRKSRQMLYIALFGDISSGKSSVIKALIAHDEQANSYDIETGVIGGTTREISHYSWLANINGTEQECILTDMPGLNEQFAELDILAIEEVQRAHIAIYLCDADLTASQFNELKRLLLLHKPCIVALNKADRYSTEELQLIIDRIKQRIQSLDSAGDSSAANCSVVTISAGGLREFIRLTPDGEEQRVQRPIPAEIKNLYEQLLKIMKTINLDQLEQLREKSVAAMMNNKLDDLDAHFKNSQSRRLVSSYTKKAVVASIATISPGTDILVQGYLGIHMIKALCKLYDVPATDIDANKLIELIQSRMDKSLPILLAIIGNGLKAFPGIGTVSGGLVHAVAYGMIFDTLGHSVARTLQVTGELSPGLVSDLYKEQLGENIESRTKAFIRLVLKLRNSDR